VEFNKAALSLADAFPADQKKAALNRLLKVGPAAGPGRLGRACWPDRDAQSLLGLLVMESLAGMGGRAASRPVGRSMCSQITSQQ
jgi:hypothetical protein